MNSEKTQFVDQTNQDIEEHAMSISTVVHYFLLILGLTAEFFAITSIINSSLPDVKGIYKIFLFASVIMMLIHQFLIIRNFHILDHISPKDYKSNSIGDWVAKCWIEDILRFLLFFTFACLTGEVAYLVIVSSKTIPLLHNTIAVADTGQYNLSWMTPLYLVSALVMCILMIIWDVLGLLHDWKDIPKFGFRQFSPTDKIVFAPFSSPYYTFVINDIISLTFWIMLNWAVFFLPKGVGIMVPILLLFLAYAIITVIRVWAELTVNIPRSKKFIKNYKKNTFMWQRKRN